jgi:hypothetical protein
MARRWAAPTFCQELSDRIFLLEQAMFEEGPLELRHACAEEPAISLHVALVRNEQNPFNVSHGHPPHHAEHGSALVTVGAPKLSLNFRRLSLRSL